MENIQLLIKAMEYIEDNIGESIKTETIAKRVHCSKSSIEKLFRYINNISIRDYIIRRRMSKASQEMVRHPEKSLLDIAMEYGYSSNEAFSRAFYSVWQVTPSEFKKNPSEFELFPGYRVTRELMEEETMKDRKKIDISKLYDCIKDRAGCYLVLGDITINNISRKAGDLAIITAMNRMEDAAGPEDIVFRIGGDEFVLLTDSKDEKYAKAICDEILSHNNEPIVWEGTEIPLSMYIKAVSCDSNGALRYSEFFSKLHSELSDEFKHQSKV